MTHSFEHRAATARAANRLVLALHASLLAITLAWQLAAGLTARSVLLAAVLAAPLLLPFKGLWQGSRYTHAWATLCVVPYFVVGTVEAVANPAARAWAAACLAVSLGLFTALIAYLRLTRPPQHRSAS